MKYFNIFILTVIVLSSFSCKKGNENRTNPKSNSMFRIPCELKNFDPKNFVPDYHAEIGYPLHEEYYLRKKMNTPREYEIKYSTLLHTHPTLSVVNVVIGIREINGEYKGYYLIWDIWVDDIPAELDITTNLTARELEEYYPECYPTINKQVKVRNIIHKDYKKIVVDFSQEIYNLHFFRNIELIE